MTSVAYSVRPFPPEPDSFPPPLTAALLNSAAALETHIQEQQQQHARDLQALTRERDQLAVDLKAASRWIVSIRKSHSRQSHAKTSRILRLAVQDVVKK